MKSEREIKEMLRLHREVKIRLEKVGVKAGARLNAIIWTLEMVLEEE